MLKLNLVLKTLLFAVILSALNLTLVIFLGPKYSQQIKEAISIGDLALIGLISFSYLIFVVFSVYIAFSAKNSLNFFISTARRISSGDFDKPVDLKADDEFGVLASSLEELRRLLRDRINTSEEAKDRAEAILFNVGEGVFAVNLKGEIIIFNRVAEKLIGFNRSQIINQHYDQILQFYNSKTKENYGQFINKVLLEGKDISLPADTVLVTAEKAEIPVAVNSSPIRNRKGIIAGGIVVFRDITHEKEIEEIRTDLISIASHQLRTPLSEIKGLISLLVDNVGGELEPKQREYMDLLNVANERMINLVNDLLNISRIEQGRLQLNFASCNLGSLAKEVHQSLVFRAGEHKQKFLLTVDPNLPNVTCDPEKTKEIISNLMENALKYTYDGGTINSRVTANQVGVWVLVKDSGVGIPKNHQKDLFQKFSRVENPLSRLTTGTGLGLYAVKQLVEKQNGRVWFESIEGKGSTFGFVLPEVKKR